MKRTGPHGEGGIPLGWSDRFRPMAPFTLPPYLLADTVDTAVNVIKEGGLAACVFVLGIILWQLWKRYGAREDKHDAILAARDQRISELQDKVVEAYKDSAKESAKVVDKYNAMLADVQESRVDEVSKLTETAVSLSLSGAGVSGVFLPPAPNPEGAQSAPTPVLRDGQRRRSKTQP